MATNCQFEGMQGKVLEAVAAFTQANERVVGQLVELSSTAAREGLRAMGELQTAAMDAARAIPMPSAPTETLEDLRRDPFAWYRKGFQAVAESTQRAAKLIETNDLIRVWEDAEALHRSLPEAWERAPEHDNGDVRAYRVRLVRIANTFRRLPTQP